MTRGQPATQAPSLCLPPPVLLFLLSQPWVPVPQPHLPIQARAVDAKIAKEGAEGLGPLTGVPLAIKVRHVGTWRGDCGCT